MKVLVDIGIFVAGGILGCFMTCLLVASRDDRDE